MKNTILRNVGLLIAGGLLLTACNKSVQNDLGAEGTADTVSVKNKVLLVLVDGAAGDEVRKIQAPNLVLMADNAIYSWDALSDFENNANGNYLTWANLLTGTTPAKHGVTGNSFSGNNFAAYPSIFTRIKNTTPAIKTASFTATTELANNLTADAVIKQSFENNDAGVITAAKAELAASGGADLVMTQLRNVELAGLSGGYNATNPAYRAAVLTMDAQIKEMMDVIAARPTYAKENWLIMIASNKGSNTPFIPTPPELWSAFKDGRHNTMFLAYNFTAIPNFRIQSAAKPLIIPYLGTTAFYNGTQDQNRRARARNTTAGNVGATGSYTIQCKVKFPPYRSGYPSFLSSRSSFTGTASGWLFFLDQDQFTGTSSGWQFNHSGGSGNAQISGRGSITDNQWHTLTVVIREEGAARNLYTFTDGALSNGPVNIAGRNLTSSGRLTVGNLPPDNNTGLGDYNVTDIRIYNAALTNAYIGANFCRTDVPDDQYKSNLISYWPAINVGADKIILDESGANNHLQVETLNPSIFNDASPRVCPQIIPAVYRSVPNSVDVAMQVYTWLGITTPVSWQLDGKTWVPQYINVR